MSKVFQTSAVKMKAIKFNYSGLMCPVFTAFANDSKQTIRFDRIDKYAAWLKQNGIDSVLVNGTVGEGVCQRIDERKQNVEEWLKSCRKYDIKCMVHIGGAAIASVIDLAEHAEEKGVDAVLCLPDLFFKPTCEEDLVDYLKKVAAHCPTRPFFYYHNPMYSKVYLSMPRLCDLADSQIPTFNGLKYSFSDLNECVACVKPGRKIFVGSKIQFLSAAIQGIDSGVLGTLNFFPELALGIRTAVKENRWADAVAAQLELINRVKEGANTKAEFNRSHKDFDCGPARKPLLHSNHH